MRAYETLLRQRKEETEAGAPADYDEEGLVLLPVNVLRAACMTELVERPEVRRTVRWLADHADRWLEKTCPRGATFVLRALWHAREVEDVDAGIKYALDWVDESMNGAGCVRHWDPYAVVAAAGTIQTAEARALLLRQVPMLLRGQHADGGWGPNKWDMHSLDVFRALKNHDLLEELRDLPPLPPDWQVVRSIPAPDGKLGWMTYEAGRLWFHNYDNGEIVGLSPEDGSVATTLRLPDVFPVGLGRWDDGLAVVQKDPKRVLKVNPDTGGIEAEFPIGFAADPMCATMVGGRLWIADSWLFPGWVVDPAHPERVPESDSDDGWDPEFRLERLLAGTCPNGIAAVEDGVWHTDYFARTMIKSGSDGRLLAMAERPFGGWPPDIAYDGENLWALDPANGRICVIEPTETAPKVKTAAGGVAADGGGSREVSGELELTGDGWRQETFSLSVVAVAEAFGQEASYEEVLARSGQAFPPSIDFVNDCKDLLQCQGWLGHLCPMDAAAASVGLEMEPLPLPLYEGDPDDAAAREAHYQTCAEIISDALARGDALITSGGWEFEEERFVEPWWAGIITGLRSDGTVVGTHLRGGGGCELRGINPGEALRDAAGTYESAVMQLSQMAWAGLAGDMAARRRLADRVDRLATTELEAAGHVRRALHALGEDVPPPAGTEGAEAPGPLDCSKLDLRADHLTVDSFSLSVQAAARLLGRDVDYETVYVLSTNCFAPGIRPEEPCKESWVLQARSRSIDLVARGVGLEWTYPPNTAELNDVPPAPDAPWGSPENDAWLREWHRKPMVRHVRRLIAEGKVIVSQGEWKAVPRTVGVSWCDWGIITGATDDGTIFGASTNGQLDNPTDYIRDGHVLSPGKPTLTDHEADLAVLERAVHRIRGDADPYRPDDHFVFGLAAMDEWIAQMERPSFQPDCAPDSRESRANAFATAMTVYTGAKASAGWLSDRAGDLSADAGRHLRSAAGHYDRIAELLHPALTGEGGEHYTDFIGDPAEQKAHADVLREVKAELAAAADEMAATLRGKGVEVGSGPTAFDGGGKSAHSKEGATNDLSST